MTCEHKWVNYQPLRGENYWCCANAGCGIKFEDFMNADLRSTYSNDPVTAIDTTNNNVTITLPSGASAPVIDKIKVVSDGTNWVPVDLKDYFTPHQRGLAAWLPDYEDTTTIPPGSKL